MRLKDIEYSIYRRLEELGFKTDNGTDNDTGFSLALTDVSRKGITLDKGAMEFSAYFVVIGTADTHEAALDLLDDYLSAPVNVKGLEVYKTDTMTEVFDVEVSIEIDGHATVDPVDGRSFTDGITVSIITLS
jgi:hypothetical protein